MTPLVAQKARYAPEHAKRLDRTGRLDFAHVGRKMMRQFRNGEPTLLAMLGGFFTTSAAEAKSSERELQLANGVEVRLNEYAPEYAA